MPILARPSSCATVLCATAAVLFLPVLLAAQSSRKEVVIPAAYEAIEGGTTHTYPFGRDDAQLQILIDGDQIGSSVALIQSLAFRPDAPFAGYPGYTKGHAIDLYPTPVTADGMSVDPKANTGNAPKTVAFDGPLALPAVAPQVMAPAGFVLNIPFKTPYVMNPAQANLLVHVRTTDLAVASDWDLDAALIYDSTLRGQIVRIGERCSYVPGGTTNSYSMSLSVGSGCYVGGSFDVTLRSQGGAPAGTWPTAVLGISPVVGTSGMPWDLSLAGMPGCHLLVDPHVAIFVSENVGTYPLQSIPIPSVGALEGVTVFTQALAAGKNGLQGAVTTDTYQARIGPATKPTSRDFQSIFYVASRQTWHMGGTGAYAPVVKLIGSFQ